jgi:hypothetical protein
VFPKDATPTLFLAVLLCAGCGEGPAPKANAASVAAKPKAAAQGPKIDPCSLVTGEEIEAVVGWKVMKATPSSYGSTAVCNFSGPQEFTQMLSLVVAPGMPQVASSAEMAAWRKKQTESYGDIKFVIAPVEGLGVPAIRNEVEGTGLATIEAAAKGMLLDVTSSTLEQAKALAAKAITRLP